MNIHNTSNIYSKSDYDNLKSKYGAYSSWSIWDPENLNNNEIIDNYISELHPSYVLIALNKSIDINLYYWKNFHDYTHARKLAYACNETLLRGSYLTDLFKDLPEAIATNLDKSISKEKIEESVKYFMQEMKDVKVSSKTEFIIFGDIARKYYEQYFKRHFENSYKVARHYSDFRMSDVSWVSEFWEIMNIKVDAETMVMEYKKTSKYS